MQDLLMFLVLFLDLCSRPLAGSSSFSLILWDSNNLKGNPPRANNFDKGVTWIISQKKRKFHFYLLYFFAMNLKSNT